MKLKSRILKLMPILLVLNSCINSAKIKPPTNYEILIGLEKAAEEGKKIKTELRIIKDLDEGISQAINENKPILLIFTGYGVINSRKLESEIILKNKEIFTMMKDKFVNVWLYVDDIKDVEKKCAKLQTFKFNGNYQPQIFILDSTGTKIDGGIGYEESKSQLLHLLKKYER